jgi:hypothetical protein
MSCVSGLLLVVVFIVCYIVYRMCNKSHYEHYTIDPTSNKKRMKWNECNNSVSGASIGADWLCRNDGYGGYNVVGVGEEKMGNSKKLMHQTNMNKALTKRSVNSGAEMFRGQTSRSILMSRPKRSGLHENMTDNKRGDPFYENDNVREFNTDAGSPNVYRGKKFNGKAGFAGVYGEERYKSEGFASNKESLVDVGDDSVIKSLPNILAPKECTDEHTWNAVHASNSCDPKQKFLHGSLSEHMTGEPATLKYAHAGLSDYAKTYDNLSKHCKSDWNSSGGNDRPADGGKWKEDRYQYGCDYYN